MKKTLAIIVIGLCAAAAHAADAGRTFLAPPGADPKTAPPFSNGVMVGTTFYVAGHLGVDPSTGKAAAAPAIDRKLRRRIEDIAKLE